MDLLIRGKSKLSVIESFRFYLYFKQLVHGAKRFSTMPNLKTTKKKKTSKQTQFADCTI